MQKSTTEIWTLRGIILLLIFAGFSVSSVMAADSPETVLSKADSLFAAKRFSEAFESYNQLFTRGYVTPGSLLRAAWIQEGRGEVAGALVHLYRYYLITSDDGAYQKMMQMAGDAGLEGYELSDLRKMHLKWGPYAVWIIAFLAIAFLAITAFLIRKSRQGKEKRRAVLAYINLSILGVMFILVNYASPPQRVFVKAFDCVLLKDASIAADRGPSARQGDLFEYDGEQDIWIRLKRNDDVLYVRRNQIILI